MGILDFFKGDDVEDHRETVKRYLKDFGLKEGEDYWQDESGNYYCRGVNSGAFLYVASGWGEEGSEKVAYFSVFVPLIHIPKTNILPFYRRLLEHGFEYPYMSVGVDGDIVYAGIARPVAALNREEVLWILVQIDWIAKRIRLEIAQEFNAPLYDFDNE
jgi:hypothetical protein